jgi:hypothetical protein
MKRTTVGDVMTMRLVAVKQEAPAKEDAVPVRDRPSYAGKIS